MKGKHIIFVCSFFLAVSLGAVLTFALPDKEFSAEENRYLTAFPRLSGETVLDGTFQANLSDYLSDQIPGRQFWIRTGTDLQKFFGKKEVNGVYLGKDQYYFQRFTEESYSRERMESVFGLIEDFAREHPLPVRLMLAPTPALILKDWLPENAPMYDGDFVFEQGEELLSMCQLIDLRDKFSASADSTQLYYRTDHHWTTPGAYAAYEEYCRYAGTERKALEEFEMELVSDSFYGTLYSKTLDRDAVPDCIYAVQNLPEVRVTFDEKVQSQSIYEYDFLERKDQYAFFFGGNWGKVSIKTGAENQRRLLVIKDSFANSFVPFLLEDYQEIVMLDLRYFAGEIEDVMEEHQITEVLFLYETSNLLTDTGILKLARSRQ